MHNPPGAAVARAITARDLAPRSLLPMSIAFAAAGVTGGLAAAALPQSTAGSATLILHFDRTLIAIAGWVVVFRTIAHLAEDGSADWLFQLFAAGASRAVYVISTALASAAAMMLGWIAGAGSFALTVLACTSRTDPLVRVMHELPFVPVPLVAACAFGAATTCVFGRVLAARIAFVLMAAPWVGLWLSIVARGELDAEAAYLRVLDYPVPRLYVSPGIAHNSYMLFYIGAAFALVLFTVDRRIGRQA